MRKTEAYEQAMQEYIKRTPRSQTAYEQANRYMPGGETRSIVFFRPHALTIDRAEGPYLYDVDGNRYIDFLNNYTSMIHGHAHPQIIESVQAALAKGICYGTSIPEQVQLAEILCERVPSVDKVRFCNSGTEAILFAVRAARAFTGKSAILKMEGGFHGSIDLVQHSIAPVLPHPQPCALGQPFPDAPGISPNAANDLYVAPYNNADAVEELLKQHSQRIAAIVVEPILGQTGAIEALPGYLQQLRSLADRYQVLLLFDEIQTLRLGMGGYQMKCGVIPDLTAMGKFIGGGFPVAAFGGRADIMDQFDPRRSSYISHSGTFNGNRIGMAAGTVSMKLLNPETLGKLERLAAALETGLQSAIDRCRIPVSVTRVGSMLHVHMVKERPIDYASTKGPHNDLTKMMHLKLLNRGIFIAPRGSLNLSTVMEKSDIEEAVRVFQEVFAEMAELFE